MSVCMINVSSRFHLPLGLDMGSSGPSSSSSEILVERQREGEKERKKEDGRSRFV